MGIAFATLELRNPVQPDLVALPVRALADGTRTAVDYVGPVEVRFANRRCFVGAMVPGDEVLLGAIPMEDMDLVVHPQTRQVTVHPDRPNMAAGIAKRPA